MTRYLLGLFTASILLIALHVYGPQLLGVLMRRGDNSDFGDKAKQPNYRYYGERLLHD